jgi:hypothetical protein
MRFIPDFLVTLLLLVVGAVGKKLIRGRRKWRMADWCLGPDLLVAAAGIDLAFLCELAKKSYGVAPAVTGSTAATLQLPAGADLTKPVFFAVLHLVCVGVFFMLALSTHQDLEEAAAPAPAPTPALAPGRWRRFRANVQAKFWQVFWLLFVWNAVGIVSLAAFLLLIKVD